MKKRHLIATVLICFLCILELFPIVYMVAGVLKNPQSLYQILLRQPDYLYKFWKSLEVGLFVVTVHVLISCMGGFAFAKYQFCGKRLLYFFMLVLMMMPVQVTLIPNYIILGKMNLLDTWGALALPCIFSPFGTIWMTQVFRSIPNEILDASKVDGATTWQSLWNIFVPTGRGGVISLVLLTFADTWNQVEQPMVFLHNVDDYPLSVFLAVVNDTNQFVSFAGSMLSMIPMFLLCLYFKDELTDGMTFIGGR